MRSLCVIRLRAVPVNYRDWYDAQRRIVRNAHGPLGDPEDEPDWSLLK